MSQQAISILKLTQKAAGAIAARRAVGFDGAQASVQGQKVLGIADFAVVNAGDQVTLDVAGTAIVETGGVFAPGDSLIVDNQGRAIVTTGPLTVKAGVTAVTSTAANGAILQGSDLPEHVFATALVASTGAGQFVEVLLRR